MHGVISGVHHVLSASEAKHAAPPDDNEGQDDEESANQGEGMALQASAAAMIPFHCWDNKYSTTVWSVQWKPGKGLVPIRPQVVLRADGSLDKNRAFVLTPDV